MMLRHLPLIAAVLPVFAMFAALLIGVSAETLPACFPPLDGCLSISATGRKPPGSFLFRLIMLPQAAILAVLWLLTLSWLRSLAVLPSESLFRVVVISGLIGALALAVYVTFLGTREPIYELMRRYGIYLGFLGTAIAQLATAIAIRRIAIDAQNPGLARDARWMLTLSLGVALLGLLNLLLKATLIDPDPAENAIEWTASLMMQGSLLLLYRSWRRTGATVSVRASS